MNCNLNELDVEVALPLEKNIRQKNLDYRRYK